MCRLLDSESRSKMHSKNSWTVSGYRWLQSTCRLWGSDVWPTLTMPLSITIVLVQVFNMMNLQEYRYFALQNLLIFRTSVLHTSLSCSFCHVLCNFDIDHHTVSEFGLQDGILHLAVVNWGNDRQLAVVTGPSMTSAGPKFWSCGHYA